MGFLKLALPFVKKILFDEGVKIVSKKLELKEADLKTDFNHAKKEKKFAYNAAVRHGIKKGLPVALAMEISRMIIINFPELAEYSVAIVSLVSGLLFVIVNIVKKKWGLNLRGIL